jgi:hypothetical protein
MDMMNKPGMDEGSAEMEPMAKMQECMAKMKEAMSMMEQAMASMQQASPSAAMNRGFTKARGAPLR